MLDISHDTHPAREKLTAFTLGQLEKSEASRIARHLGVCQICQRVVQSLPDCSTVSRFQPDCRTPTPQPAQPEPVTTGFADEIPPELLSHQRYRVLQRLGAGGMGVVYKAEHRLMNRTVALKVINKALTATPGVVERFRGEVRAQARLSHPNLVQAHDAEQAGDLHFLVMEFVEGVDLAWLVHHEGPLPVEKACDVARQAALGLAHAFQQGLVHRDIKPGNLMVTPQGIVKVLDFGLARIAEQDGDGLTEFGQGMGTPDYVAPEQIRDARSVDTRADLYSLGCTLYFLLTGRPPFPEGNAARKMASHLEKQPTALQELRPELPAALVSVVERMMAKEAARRYQTPDEVVAALKPFCQLQEEKAPLPARNRLWWSAAVALVVVATALSLAAVFLRQVETPHGTLEIVTDDPEVRVLVKQQGKVVEIIDPRSKRTVNLKTGGYELELSDNSRSLELSTSQVNLTRAGEVIVTVTRIPETVAEPTKVKPLVRPDPKVLTVSKNAADGGQYRTIREALEKVDPGMTIRVVDDADYGEYLQINRPEQYRGVTLEATGKATLRKLSGENQMVLIRGVSGFTLRGFRLNSVNEPHCQVYIGESCPGVVLDRLDMKSGHQCVNLYQEAAGGEDAPIVIQNCTLWAKFITVIIEGALREDQGRPLPCGHVVIRENTLQGEGDAVVLKGAVHKVHIVGNRFLDTNSGVNLVHLLPGTADILVANNTLLRNQAALRIFDDHKKGKSFLKCRNMRIQNNLVLAPQHPRDLVLFDHVRGTSGQTRAGDLEALLKSTDWRFSNNWREIEADKSAAQSFGCWIPARDNDRLEVPITVLSRKSGDTNFLRPGRDSSLATAGVNDDALPAYVGAVPPEGVEPRDWSRTWKSKE